MNKVDHQVDPHHQSSSSPQTVPSHSAETSPIEPIRPGTIESLLSDDRLPAQRRTELLQTANQYWGNQRVQRLVQTLRANREAIHTDSGVAIRRYEAGEHQRFGGAQGDTTMVNINGVQFSYSEMMAMGDLFEDPGDMYKAKPEELNKIKALLKQDRDHFDGVPNVPAVTNKQFSEATGGRYTDLASKNTSHFAGENMERWESLHRKAIKLAKKGDMNGALQTNSFADHFLTDAFSAGHLINKKAVMNRATLSLPGDDYTGSILETFAKAIATQLFANTEVATKLGPFEAKRNAMGYTYYPMDVETLTNVIEILRHWKMDYVMSMFAKLVHDRLNQDIKPDGSGGIEVTNNAGDTWRLSGDETLARSDKTLQIGQKAVAQSRQNIQNAGQNKDYDPDKAIDYVEVFVPRPTAAGQKQIDDATNTLTDPKQQATIDGFAAVAIKNIDLLISQLVDKGMMRRKVVPTAAPAPAAGASAPTPPPPAEPYRNLRQTR